MFGILASAVELGTMPTIRNTWAPTCRVSPMCRPTVLDAATSSGFDGALPAETYGMPGPCSGAPKAVTFRVDVPSFMIVPTQASGAAATTPGAAAIRARSTSGNGVEPRKGPAAPSLTTNVSTPREPTVLRASTPKPFASPVITSVIPKISAVLTIAMMRRRFRHCMSRRAAKSIHRKYQLPVSRGRVCYQVACASTCWMRSSRGSTGPSSSGSWMLNSVSPTLVINEVP